MKGTYVLLIKNSASREVKVGKLGSIAFKNGFYAYVGSALAGLEQRVGRHLRAVGENKKLHWHIDYFLASPGVEVKEVVFAETALGKRRRECEIAANLLECEGLDFVKNFGCSDCSCRSHLFFSASLGGLKEAVCGSFDSVGEHFLATKIKPVCATILSSGRMLLPFTSHSRRPTS